MDLDSLHEVIFSHRASAWPRETKLQHLMDQIGMFDISGMLDGEGRYPADILHDALITETVAVFYRSLQPHFKHAHARGLNVVAIIDLRSGASSAILNCDPEFACPPKNPNSWVLNVVDGSKNIYATHMPANPRQFFDDVVWKYIDANLLDQDARCEITYKGHTGTIPANVVQFWAQRCATCGNHTSFHGPPVCKTCKADAAAAKLLEQEVAEKKKPKQKKRVKTAAAAASAVFDFVIAADRETLEALGFVFV